MSIDMKSSTNSSGILAFIKELCTNPKRVGAAFPTPKRAANIIAEQVPSAATGKIIELGGGTGVITQALLDHGIDPKNLTVIEYAAHFYNHLKLSFPNITTVKGDAAELNKLVPHSEEQISAIISSLPLRLLSPPTVTRIYEEIHKLLAKDGTYIQYTYHLSTPRDIKPAGFELLYRKVIWSVIPPIRIDVFKKQ